MNVPPTVPPSYIGLWQRKGIWRSNGEIDVTTLVLWFQSASFHIDLRLGQIAFAGKTVVEGERCSWIPEIGFPSVSSEPDVGIMRFDAPGLVHESAPDASYYEKWVKIAEGPVTGWRLQASDSALIAYVVESRDWLAYACQGDPGEFSFARRNGDSWRIHASNKPERAGAKLAVGDIASMPLPGAAQWRITARC